MDLPDLFPANPMQLRTIRHYNFSEVSSAMQKAIRRGDAALAGSRSSSGSASSGTSHKRLIKW